MVNKKIAERFPSHPEYVQECMREAEASMNHLALERGRTVSAPPRLSAVAEATFSSDLLELTFTAPTRSI